MKRIPLTVPFDGEKFAARYGLDPFRDFGVDPQRDEEPEGRYLWYDDSKVTDDPPILEGSDEGKLARIKARLDMLEAKIRTKVYLTPIEINELLQLREGVE